ncbi:LuxR C-terminal-related transcriptional regulator [Serratia fonticola]
MNVHIISNDFYMVTGLRQLMSDRLRRAEQCRPFYLINKDYIDSSRIVFLDANTESEIVAQLSLIAKTNSRVIILGKNSDDEIRSHYYGCHYIPRDCSVENFNALFDSIMHTSMLRIRNVLTAREKIVMQELLQGKSGTSVAKKFDISQKTISTHKRSALHKLKLKNIHLATFLSKVLVQQ